MWQSPEEKLFWQLYHCKNEQEVSKLIKSRREVFSPANWHPLGGNAGNFAIVENQQSSPIAALVEKLTNATDAVLMRRCYEEQIDPRSAEAPKSIQDAVARFFPMYGNWDGVEARSEQARSIQILADGTKRNTSLVVYDDGEGQHPEQFEETFLSLLRGNKRNIEFVQGKYNMGGTGAIVFCGKRRYQLIASRRYDSTGKFGFTLIRENPQRDEADSEGIAYQYLKVNDAIPAFSIDELNLGLHRRLYRTGTVIKLYSYDLHRNRHIFRDLSPSLNQYLFEPALPYTLVESPARYKRTKDDYAHVNYGLRRHLNNREFVEESFSETITDRSIGKLSLNVYVFKAKTKGRSAADTRKAIRDRYFKDSMQVVFTAGGQVHGHYTAGFITRSLQFALLKDYLLIHVDCAGLKPAFRRELFMGSRDRLMKSNAASELRKKLGDSLKNGRLKDIYKRRKDRLSYDSAEDDDLLKRLGSDLPFDKEMQDLIKQTMQLDAAGNVEKPKPRPIHDPVPFVGKRFPTFFHIDRKAPGTTPLVEVQSGSSKSIRFASDVEDAYFDRTEDPGGLELGVMNYKPRGDSPPNDVDLPNGDNDISDYFAITRSSPQDGKIRVVLEPTRALQVGDEVQIRANLEESGNPDGLPPTMLWVRITDPQSKPNPKPKPEPEPENLGLPKLVKVYREAPDDNPNAITWDAFNEGHAVTMDQNLIMYPFVPGEKLEQIFINMHSNALHRYKLKRRNPSAEQNALADRLYVSRVYYHTLFLYLISKKKQYEMQRQNGSDNFEDVELSDYLKDLFDSNYGAFLLNFDTAAIMEGLG